MSSLDVNRDGYVTRADFNQMAAGMGLGQYGAAAANQSFSRMDRDRNGILSPYEQASAYGGYQRYWAWIILWIHQVLD